MQLAVGKLVQIGAPVSKEDEWSLCAVQARAYVWSGLGMGGSTFRSCNLVSQASDVLATPPGAIESHAFAYIPTP